MSDQHFVSRRESLKSIGVVGAALVAGEAAVIAGQADPHPVASNQDKPAANAVEVASSRFTKGHS